MRLIPAVCPQCGAKVEFSEGAKATVCGFCGTKMTLDNNEVIHIVKEDVEGKSARLLSAAEKYWDTLKFQEMKDACKQLVELNPDNPVVWLYNAVSANALGNISEFERSMDEARKLSAKKMGSAESKFFSEKVDWAYGNLSMNIAGYVKAGDSRNVGAIAHMMVWMKPDDPLGWYYRALAIRMGGIAATGGKIMKDGVGQTSAQAMKSEQAQALSQAWQLYDNCCGRLRGWASARAQSRLPS